jgi:hypothetical protein
MEPSGATRRGGTFVAPFKKGEINRKGAPLQHGGNSQTMTSISYQPLLKRVRVNNETTPPAIAKIGT